MTVASLQSTVAMAPAAAAATRDRLRVLLVDDDTDHAAVVRRTLERQGAFVVTHVTDGTACLESLARESYSVVLLDYSLPRMNGLEVLERIRQLDVAVPVIIATGQGDERVVVQAMEAGAMDYVIKTSGYFATLPIVLNKVLKQHEVALDNARLYAESKRQEDRLAQIFDSTSDGIMLVDRDGAIVCANRRAGELLGIDPAGACGWPLADVVVAACGGVPNRAVARLEALFVTPSSSSDGDLELAEGQRTVHWVGQPTNDGEMQGFTITFQDVTREREISRMKSDFVSFAAHQLRTPLSGMKWMLEVAREEPGISPTVASCIADASASADRLITMIGDLLDISRLESEGFATDMREVDVGTLTLAVLDDVAANAAKKEHRMTVTGGENLPPVVADEQLLRQAMLNVVSNAIKYTPEQGAIVITIAEEDGGVSWLVRDNGIGIPKSAQGRLFEKFYRADNASAVDANGRGLGLYMVRLIITRFGGRMHWASEEGRGTTFGFVLPLGGTPCQRSES
jgi:two-component system phosphate regulon sensor histidine kinase PhoR